LFDKPIQVKPAHNDHSLGKPLGINRVGFPKPDKQCHSTEDKDLNKYE